MLELLTSLPFRCAYQGQTAIIEYYHPEQDTYKLYMGVDNGVPVHVWADPRDCYDLGVGINLPYKQRTIGHRLSLATSAEDRPPAPQIDESYHGGGSEIQEPRAASKAHYDPVYDDAGSSWPI